MLGKLALRRIELLSLGQYLPLLRICYQVPSKLSSGYIQQNLSSTNSSNGEFQSFFCLCIYFVVKENEYINRKWRGTGYDWRVSTFKTLLKLLLTARNNQVKMKIGQTLRDKTKRCFLKFSFILYMLFLN